MRYTIYEHPVTRKFALLPLPPHYAEGDALPIAGVSRWFMTHPEAVAALADLLNDGMTPEEAVTDGKTSDTPQI